MSLLRGSAGTGFFLADITSGGFKIFTDICKQNTGALNLG
jgi:hypothetical protein